MKDLCRVIMKQWAFGFSLHERSLAWA